MPLIRTGNGLLASGNIYPGADPAASGFRSLSKGWVHFLGRGLSWPVNEILRAEVNIPLIRPGNGLLLSGNIYSGDDPSAGGFRSFPKGWGHFLGMGLS